MIRNKHLMIFLLFLNVFANIRCKSKKFEYKDLFAISYVSTLGFDVTIFDIKYVPNLTKHPMSNIRISLPYEMKT